MAGLSVINPDELREADMSQDLVFEVDKRELLALERTYSLGPKKMRGFIKKRWRKTGKKIVSKMRKSHFSGPTGGHTIRFRSKRQRGSSEFIHVRNALVVKQLKFGVKGSFGGYMVIGMKGALGEKKMQHFIAYILEHGTGRLQKTMSMTKGAISSRGRRERAGKLRGAGIPAREPFRHAWEGQREGLNIVRATSRGIDDYIKSDWRGK